ncbi:MAG TPA: hypothetical protein VGG06_01020 [Thermoanaerobaculia bacterium]
MSADEKLDPDPEMLAEALLAAGAAGAPALGELRLCLGYEQALEAREKDQRRELPSWVDPHDLAQSGWGVIFALDERPAIEAGLRPLIERRQDQAGELYQRLAYKPHESGERFLRRHGETPGVVRPEVLPYYLLIAGDPEKIPWKLQYELSVNHAVGRIAFDEVKSYGRYAKAVVEAETRGVGRPRRASLLSVEGDGVTRLLASHLAEPLQQKWPRLGGGWELDLRRRDDASKDGLRRLLTGADLPGLLLASCHGLRAAPGAPEQEAVQGSLVCQDGGCFSGDDVDGCQVAGLTVMTFACYGAGTPVRDNYPDASPGAGPPAIALRPFVARLPQEMLARGALAVVGHVDRGWTYSFAWPDGERDLTAVASLDDMLYRLLRGDRVGHALRPLCQRYKALAADLAKDLELFKGRPELAESPKAKERLAFKWTVHNDARNFVILGDPAVYVLGRKP